MPEEISELIKDVAVFCNRAAEITTRVDRMASAFEHDDLKRACAY